jgi:hypothetical protein
MANFFLSSFTDCQTSRDTAYDVSLAEQQTGAYRSDRGGKRHLIHGKHVVKGPGNMRDVTARYSAWIAVCPGQCRDMQIRSSCNMMKPLMNMPPYFPLVAE